MTYGMNGEGGVDGSGDVSDIWTRLNLEETPVAEGTAKTLDGIAARKMYFDTMKARCVMTNTGTTTVYWEVFECVCRDDVPKSTEGSTLQNFYNTVANSAYQATQAPTGAGAPGATNSYNQTSSSLQLPNKNTIGMTPFQFRHFCQRFKILKTTKFQAQPGNTISFSCGTTRNLSFEWDDERPLLAKRGVTRVYLVRQWGAMQQTPVLQVAPSQAAFEIEKDYNVKILDRKLPQLNYYSYTNQTP